MNTPSHDFVTVDMRGLKAALVTRAQAQRVSVSVLVRAAVERELGLVDSSDEPETGKRAAAALGSIVKLSIRLTSGEAEQLDAGARGRACRAVRSLRACWPTCLRCRVTQPAVSIAWPR